MSSRHQKLSNPPYLFRSSCLCTVQSKSLVSSWSPVSHTHIQSVNKFIDGTFRINLELQQQQHDYPPVPTAATLVQPLFSHLHYCSGPCAGLSALPFGASSLYSEHNSQTILLKLKSLCAQNPLVALHSARGGFEPSSFPTTIYRIVPVTSLTSSLVILPHSLHSGLLTIPFTPWIHQSSGPLHLLFPPPRMFFPRSSVKLPLSLLSYLLISDTFSHCPIENSLLSSPCLPLCLFSYMALTLEVILCIILTDLDYCLFLPCQNVSPH